MKIERFHDKKVRSGIARIGDMSSPKVFTFDGRKRFPNLKNLILALLEYSQSKLTNELLLFYSWLLEGVIKVCL